MNNKTNELLQELLYNIVSRRSKDFDLIEELNDKTLTNVYHSIDGLKSYFSLTLSNQSSYDFCIQETKRGLVVKSLSGLRVDRHIFTTICPENFDRPDEIDFVYQGEHVDESKIRDLLDVIHAVPALGHSTVIDLLEHKHSVATATDNSLLDTILRRTTLLTTIHFLMIMLCFCVFHTVISMVSAIPEPHLATLAIAALVMTITVVKGAENLKHLVGEIDFYKASCRFEKEDNVKTRTFYDVELQKRIDEIEKPLK